MSSNDPMDLSEFSMVDLFRMEADTQVAALNQGLLAFEGGAGSDDVLEAVMRAAHSIKGAARMVGANAVVRVAHGMEDCFVAAQRGDLRLESAHIDALLKGADLIATLVKCPDEQLETPSKAHEKAIDELEGCYVAILAEGGNAGRSEDAAAPLTDDAPGASAPAANSAPEQYLRISSARLTRLTGFASEALVEVRWLHPYLKRIWAAKRRHFEMVALLDRLRIALEETPISAQAQDLFAQAYAAAAYLRRQSADSAADLEEFDRRLSKVTDRIYHEVLSSRMRPFADVVQGLPRMVRDLGRRLDKTVRLETEGLATLVDREVLERVLVPIKHLIQNAIDHGIEPPQEREAQGKPRQAVVHVAASHSSGMLLVMVKDDGRGIALEPLRQKVLQKGLASPDTAANLSANELLNFLFLPGFSTRDTVTDLSGRGVGLDVVHDAVQALHGTVHIASKPGEGTQFQLLLPLTLSVIRALLVEVAGESFAFPLARIDKVLKISSELIENLDGAHRLVVDGEPVAVAWASEILELSSQKRSKETAVVIFSDRLSRYGIVVERFLGEHDLALQALDPQLGKVQHISAAAQLDDGLPTLIIDVDDLIRSMESLSRRNPSDPPDVQWQGSEKRILIVEDSLTVREATRAVLQARGFTVDVAVDGKDGWNKVCATDYELVITDLDMPRMNGYELIGLIRKNLRRSKLPVIILSYKGRLEDRRRGFDAGADYYLAKTEVDDGRLLETVVDLIGEPRE